MAKQDCTKQGCSEATPPPKKETSVRVSLFFDGTGNNKTNAESTDAPKVTGMLLHDNSSYKATSSLSNVARLEKTIKNVDGVLAVLHLTPIYIEGVGTTDNKRDYLLDQGFGSGDTGVKAKNKKMLDALVTRIKSIPTDTIIKYIHIDVFGFSRGAATARYFIYSALEDEDTNLKKQLSSHTINSIVVKFAGLFDTVASYGEANPLSLDHSNDTTELHLDAIKNAEKAVHLTANEEHRKNFRLTNIKSKGGIEISLPGVHSDIGGGYIDNYNEELEILKIDLPIIVPQDEIVKYEKRFNDEKKWLIDSGWYTEKEITIKTKSYVYLTTIRDIPYLLKVKRTMISNQYSYIPLHLMAKHAKENALTFDASLESNYPIPEDLDEINKQVNNVSKIWRSLNTDEMKKLRHKYLHFSSFYGVTLNANDPQFTNNDNMNGSRERIIQDG